MRSPQQGLGTSDKSPSSKDKAFIRARVTPAMFNATEVHKSMLCVCVILG